MSQINYTPEDLIDHHGSTAIIKDRDGRILMQEHVKYGFWTPPVGKAKNGQSVVEALKEEVFEETNLKVLDCKEVTTRTDVYDRNGVNVKVTAHIFEVTKYSGVMENKEPNKHKQQLFLSIDEIMKLPYLSDVTLTYLNTLGIQRAPKIL